MIYLFESVDNAAALPMVSNFITSLKPTYRKHSKLLNEYLRQKTADARLWAKEVGADIAVETATNTLDMMVARELRGEDWMTDEEMRDELYLCEATDPHSLKLNNRPYRGDGDFCNHLVVVDKVHGQPS